MHSKYLIVGNGVAGINAAKSLAQNGAAGEIVVYAAEPYHYYNRWQLPALLAGQKSPQQLYFYPPSWYAERGIHVNLGMAVRALDPARRAVTLADGREVSYDRLLLATGGRAFVPPIAGADKRGVFTLRTLDDAEAIRAYAAKCERAIVIGGGLLGLEAAYSLSTLGLKATVVEVLPRLLPRQLDAPGSALFQELVERKGIQVVTGVVTERILGGEEAAGVAISSGAKLAGELIVISAGIRSEVGLAKMAGLAVNRGTVVNEWMETSAPGIFAAGDAAEYRGQVYGIIPAAIEQAQVAAARMMDGQVAPYRGTIPSTTLKVADIDLTCVGEVNPEGPGYAELRSEDREQGFYRKLVLREGRLVGAILLGDKASVAPISRLIQGGVPIDGPHERLLEKDFDFRMLLTAARPSALRYECTVCGYIYDPGRGDPERGIPSGTSFEALPEGWVCPMCGAEKRLFNRLLS